jgi:hypothetical protein
MLVRLTRKLAAVVNGVDLSRHRVGEWIDVSAHDAEMLITEGWAAVVPAEHRADAHRADRADARIGRSRRKQRYRS